MMRQLRPVVLVMLVSLLLAPFSAGAQTPATGEADLAGLKTYMVKQAANMKIATTTLLDLAQDYYDLAADSDFDYEALWAAHADALVPWAEAARAAWREAHRNYEFNEGLVAGIPSLARYDVLIDAGPSGADDPTGALDNQVTLPSGQVLDQPGNYFHYLTEPALWGTEPAFIGAAVDLDNNGKENLGDAIPDADVLLGAVQALDAATSDLQTDVAAWEPGLSDVFTAMVVMIPTMDGYFAEWSQSPFVLGNESTQAGFVGGSRLVDVAGILSGLALTYDTVSPLIVEASPELRAQTSSELEALVAFVNELKQREQAGTRFTPEQADQFGAELQTRATALAGQIAQAAALLGIEIQEG